MSERERERERERVNGREKNGLVQDLGGHLELFCDVLIMSDVFDT